MRVAEQEHVLLVTMHHIVTDGWSMGVMVRELTALYGARVRGKEPMPLPELAMQYADYAVWQREWMQGEVLEKQLEYWRKQLAGRRSAGAAGRSCAAGGAGAMRGESRRVACSRRSC